MSAVRSGFIPFVLMVVALGALIAVDGFGMVAFVFIAAYGIGNWHLYNGRRAEAERIFRRIVAGGQWGAFGYIAAEAELARKPERRF